jgi:hypothetical protein
MDKYIGVKLVEAAPAFRKDGKVYLLDESAPSILDPVEDGYKVVYPDGYVSWSPKSVFEDAYQKTTDIKFGLDIIKGMNSPDYKERFKAEYLQLKIRAEGLAAMLEKYKAGTLNFKPSCSYDLLNGQLRVMTQYKMTLEERARIENIDLEVACSAGC